MFVPSYWTCPSCVSLRFSASRPTLSPTVAYWTPLAQKLDHPRAKVPKNDAQEIKICHPKHSSHSSVWALKSRTHALPCKHPRPACTRTVYTPINTCTAQSEVCKHRATADMCFFLNILNILWISLWLVLKYQSHVILLLFILIVYLFASMSGCFALYLVILCLFLVIVHCFCHFYFLQFMFSPSLHLILGVLWEFIFICVFICNYVSLLW